MIDCNSIEFQNEIAGKQVNDHNSSRFTKQIHITILFFRIRVESSRRDTSKVNIRSILSVCTESNLW